MENNEIYHRVSNPNNICDFVQQSNGGVPKLEGFDIADQGVSQFLSEINSLGYGKAEFFGDISKKGPVAVIFRELHNVVFTGNMTKEENFRVFIVMRQYFRFLATEGTDKGVQPRSDIIRDTRQIINFLLADKLPFSSVGIKTQYSDILNVCGVDMPPYRLAQLETEYYDRMSNWDIENKGFKDSEKLKLNIQRDIQIQEWSRQVQTVRNQLFVANILRILSAGDLLPKGGNFIPIITGGDHPGGGLVQDFIEAGFKGVIVFTPKSYDAIQEGTQRLLRGLGVE